VAYDEAVVKQVLKNHQKPDEPEKFKNKKKFSIKLNSVFITLKTKFFDIGNIFVSGIETEN
jgi:hypothetical protein